MDQNHQDPLADVPDEVRNQNADAIANSPAERIDEIVYEILAAHCGHLTKQQLLEIDLKQYDQLRTYPTYEGTDWQLMRDRMAFLQTAVRVGIPWSHVVRETFPFFGPILKPPFQPVCELLEPSAYQPAVYDQSRHTPATWAQEADAGWRRHRDELLTPIQNEFDQLVASGQLKLFERPRVTKEATRKEPIMDERIAFELAARSFFLEVTWADLASEYPPKSGYRGSPTDRAGQKKKRANQIRMRVGSLLKHLGLPPLAKCK